MISTILDEVSAEKSINEKVRILQENDSSALRTILVFALHPDAKWLLPKGKVPYKSIAALENDTLLYSEARRLYLFLEGGNPNLQQTRREHLFIQLMESLPPAEAKLLEMVKDKKLPKGITPFLVNKAFGDLIPVETTEEKNEQV